MAKCVDRDFYSLDDSDNFYKINVLSAVRKTEKMLNKRGQTSEAMTWIVATLIILVLLGISLYATSLLSKLKITDYKTDGRTQDVVMEESLFSYFSIEDSAVQEKVFESLDKMNREEKFYEDFNSKFQQIKFNLEKMRNKRGDVPTAI